MSFLTSLLVDLKANAEQALRDADLPVRHSVITHGDITWDDRCGGYLYVRVITSGPTGGNHRCAVPLLEHALAVGVLRCIAVVDDEGRPPATSVITDESLNVMLDADALFKMLNCDFNWTPYGNAKTIQTWTPLARNGGYTGGEWQFNVREVPPCGC